MVNFLKNIELVFFYTKKPWAKNPGKLFGNPC
jgi:hypothetical protein